jgi:mannose-6-phosphate isomerase
MHYAWGSRTALPELLGTPSPSDDPWAEIWFGAHPLAPSLLPNGRRLSSVEPELPYLVKLIAADKPLSVQVHPDRHQAVEGFDREEHRGIARAAPERSFRDRNHKPELLVALAHTDALAGMRRPRAVLRLADAIGAGPWHDLLRPLRSALPEPDALRQVVGDLLTLPRADLCLLLDAVSAARQTDRSSRRRLNPADRRALVWTDRLREQHPADPGALAPVLMNVVRLAPGEGLYIPPGLPHAYLRGVGMEVQATSDNVLRAALTAKHVDVATFLSILDARPTTPFLVHPVPVSAGLDSYPVPNEDFQVWRAVPGRGTVRVPVDGTVISVTVRDSVSVAGLAVPAGHGAYVPRSAERELVVRGGGECYVACGAPLPVRGGTG